MHRIQTQRGYFLLLAVMFIMVIGVMGSLIAYTFSNRAMLSLSQQNGLQALYNAESALQIGVRSLTRPDYTNRISCTSMTGATNVTNAALNSGTFTLATINSSPIFANTTLNGALTASSTSIVLTSATGFAASGRVLVDREAIDYAAISGNTLIGLKRGAGGTTAASHTTGTRIGEYQCSYSATSGIPNLTSPSYYRQLQMNVQLQNGFAVGNVASSQWTTTHWNYPTENSWTYASYTGGTPTALNAISMLSDVDGFAVGSVSASSLNFLRWNGSTWTVTTLAGACGTQDLFGVSMVSSKEGYAVGGSYRPACASSGNFRFNIVKWNGTSWSVLTPATSPATPADPAASTNLNAVHVIDTAGNGTATLGFAVGDTGVIVKYNGTNWVTDTSPTTKNLEGVYVVSASEAWAAGASGTILRWNGSTWSVFTSPATTSMLSITMLDTNGDGLADVGWIGAASGRIFSYNGSSWSYTDLGSGTFNGISAIKANDVWAVGTSGIAYHFDGSSWTAGTSGVGVALNGVSMIPSTTKPYSGWKQNY